MARYRIRDNKAAGVGSALWVQDLSVQKKGVLGWRTVKQFKSDDLKKEAAVAKAMEYIKELMSPSSFVLFDTKHDLDLISDI